MNTQQHGTKTNQLYDSFIEIVDLALVRFSTNPKEWIQANITLGENDNLSLKQVGQYKFILTQFTNKESRVVKDPEVTVEIILGESKIIPLQYNNEFVGTYINSYDNKGSVNIESRKEMVDLVHFWLTNLRLQGYRLKQQNLC